MSISLKDKTATNPSARRAADFKKERDDYLGDFNLDQEMPQIASKHDIIPATKRIIIAGTPTDETNKTNTHLQLLQPMPPNCVTHMAMSNSQYNSNKVKPKKSTTANKIQPSV